jgi:hypothetical protein
MMAPVVLERVRDSARRAEEVFSLNACVERCARLD